MFCGGTIELLICGLIGLIILILSQSKGGKRDE